MKARMARMRQAQWLKELAIFKTPSQGNTVTPQEASAGWLVCAGCLAFCTFIGLGALRAEAGSTAKATKADVLALADRYAARFTPALNAEDAATVKRIQFTLQSQRPSAVLHQRTIEEFVNLLSVTLASNVSVEAVAVASASLLREAPDNPRTANLFATVVHSIQEYKDAVTAMEYARSLDPKRPLMMLNLANGYLDTNQTDQAKVLIDQVLAADSSNRSAYTALASYWLKKQDGKRAIDAMMKAASFGGWTKKTTEKNEKRTETNEVKPEDGLTAMEAKLKQVKDIVPVTTADLVGGNFPDVARKIREKYGRLVDDERMSLPALPELNTSSLMAFHEKSVPYLGVWVKAFASRANKGTLEIVQLQTGVNPSDSNAVKKEKAKAAAQKQTTEAMAQAQRMLEQMQVMGMPQDKIDRARAKLEQAAQKQGVDLAAILSKGAAADPEADRVPPGFDYGSIFAATNYRDYLRIRQGFELYLDRYFRDYDPRVAAIMEAYGKLMKQEQSDYDANVKKISDAIERERQAQAKQGGAVAHPPIEKDVRWRKETLRHKKAVNRMGEDFFQQWVNLAVPRYTQKLKPVLDDYWAVNALYIRNMNQPEIMKREYLHCKQTFWFFANRAVATLAGGSFTYLGETDEEEAQLRADIKAAEEAALQKAQGYQESTKIAEKVLERWLEENLTLGVSIEFLSFKISPRTLSVEAYVAGINIREEYDFKNKTLTVTRSLAAKLDIGLELGPVKAKVEAGVDMFQSRDTIDFRSGQVIDGGSRFAKGEVSGSMNLGPVKLGAGTEVTIDPALESEVRVEPTEYSAKLNYKGAGVKLR